MSKFILKAIPANASSAAVDKTLGNIDTAGSTKRLTVQAQPKTQYRLVDAKTGEVVKNQTVLRNGKQLQVMVDGVNVADLDNFFPEEAVNAAAPADSASYLVDTGAAGAPSYGVVSAQTPVELSANGVSTLWTPGMPALPLVEPVAFAGPALAAVSASTAGGLAAGLGLAAAASAGGGGGSSGGSSSTSSASIKGAAFKAEVADYTGLVVEAFDAAGQSQGKANVGAGGKYTLKLDPAFKGGSLVLKMSYDPTAYKALTGITATKAPTFYDEATGETKDFTKPLYAVVNYGADSKDITVNVTPLTNLAATVAGVNTTSDKPRLPGTATETEKLVKEANIKVAQKFGLSEADLTSADVQTTKSDKVNTYGVALAIMSQMEKKQAVTDTSKDAQDAVAELFKSEIKDGGSSFTDVLKVAVTDLKASAGTNNDYLKNIDTSKLEAIVKVAEDAKAPALVGGVAANTDIKGTKVYLHFDSELSKNTAGVDAFTVKTSDVSSTSVAPTSLSPAAPSANTPVTVQSVAIDGNDVVLTLATAIKKGQTVTVSYTDPTANTNDLLAVQDLAGNDAVTFSATAVTNNVAEADPVITVNAGQSFSYAENQTTKGGFEALVLASATGGITVTKFRFADSQTSVSSDGWYSIANDGKISLTSAGLGAGKASNDFETKINGGNSLVYGVQAGDSLGNWSAAQQVTLKVTNVADAPSVSSPVSFIVLEDVASNLVLAQDAFADPDSTDLTVTLNVKDDYGTLSYDAVKATAANITVTPSGKTFAFNGKTSALNAYFSTAGNLKYQDAANYSGTRVLNIEVSDGTYSKSITSNIKVTAVNDAPAGADKTLTISEEGSKTFAAADFGFTDASDTPANNLSAVIITSLPANGSLKFNGAAVTKDQSIAATDLGKLVYTPAVNGNGDSYASIGFKVQDNGGTANDGKNTSATVNTLTMNVTPVNDAPVRTAGADITLNINEDSASTATPLGLSAYTYSPGGGADETSQTLSYQFTNIPSSITLWNGQTQVTTSTTGLTLADMQSLKYKTVANANDSTAFNLTWTVTDSGNGTNSITESLSVKVNAVNDAPVNTVPASVVTVEANITTYQLTGTKETKVVNDSSVAITGLSVSDVDAGSSNMSVTLSVQHGSLAHKTASGVSFTDTSASSFKASGSKADLNDWLDSQDLTYTPATDFKGTDTLTMLTSDGGNTGSGGEKTDTDSVPLNVTDTTGPTLLKVETDINNGAIVYLTYSEALDTTHAPSKSDFTLMVKVTADNSLVEDYSVDSLSVTDRVVTLMLNKALQVEQSVSLAYTLNGDTAVVQDVQSNDATSFDTAVTIKVPDLVKPVVTAGQLFDYNENLVSGSVVANKVLATDNIGVTDYRFASADGKSGAATSADGYFSIDADGKITITAAGQAAAVNNFENTLGSNGVATTDFSYSVQAGDDYGNWSVATGVTLNVKNVNEAPTLTSITTLTGLSEDTGNEITYEQLKAASNAADVDAGDTIRFFIDSVSSGTLQKWNGDVSGWTNYGTGNKILSVGQRLKWTPSADVNGDGINAFKVTAMDAQDVKSASSIQVKANVAAVNDAPTVLSGKESVALTAIAEDASSITGATVSSLFGDSFSDAKDNVSGGSSANTLSGIAITGNAATAAQGTWQWSANGSTNWTDIPNDTAGSDAPTNTHVYYLRADASLRFAPATDFNGTPGTLTTHLVESSWSNIGGASNGLRVDNPDSQYYTATAVTLSTSVTPTNDRPTVASVPQLSVDEDVTTDLVLTGTPVDDIDGDILTAYLWVTSTTNGTAGHLAPRQDNSLTSVSVDDGWDGSNAYSFVTLKGTVDAINTYLTTSGNISYTSKQNFNGTLKLNLQAKDASEVMSSISVTDFTINAVNDKPTVVDGQSTVTLDPIDEDQDPTTYSGATVGSLFGASFSDDKDGSLAQGFVGIGITHVASNDSQGNWQYQYQGNWVDIPTSVGDVPSATNVFYFDLNTALRFKPAAHFSGTPGGITAYLIETPPNFSGSLGRPTSIEVDYFSADPVTLTTSVTKDTTPPTQPSLVLASDTGRDHSDGITSNGKINVTTSSDTASWQYSTDNGATWTTGSGTSFEVSEGKYTAKQIQVKAFDTAANSASTDFGALTVAKSMSEVVSYKIASLGRPEFSLFFDSTHNFDGTDWNFSSSVPLTATFNGASQQVTYTVNSDVDHSMFVQLGNLLGFAVDSVITLSYVDPNPNSTDTGTTILRDIAGNESPSFTVYMGGTANDNLVGTNVNNFFFGSGGNDTMTGGTANDTYIWQKGDAGAFGSTDTVTDTIKNFSSWNSTTGTGDKLNIAALLDHSTYTNLIGGRFMSSIEVGKTVNGVDNCTVIILDINGWSSGGPTQEIVLENVDLLTQNGITASYADNMANQLISKGVLIA